MADDGGEFPRWTAFDVSVVLRRVRAQLGLTQLQFAEKVGVPHHVVYRMETETLQSVDGFYLRKLSTALGVAAKTLDPKNYVEMVPVEQDYWTPKTRRDCLSTERRFRLDVLRTREEGGRSFQVEPDGLPDGANCARPCPYVRCAHHTYLEVQGTSANPSIRWNHPGIEVEDMAELYPDELDRLPADEIATLLTYFPGRLVQSCSLDVADAGCHDTEEVGFFLNITREGVRLAESRAFRALTEDGEEDAEGTEEGSLLEDSQGA